MLLCALTGRVFEPVGFMKRELELESISAARRVADDQPFFGCAGLLRMYASSRASSSLFARFATSRAHRWPTYCTTTSPSSTTLSHPPPSALADSPPLL